MSNKVGKCCGLLAVALVLLAASVTHANGQQAVELLNQICAGKKVDLATVSQVRLLIEQLRSEQRPAACSETAANSILELENVLSKANVCSKEATDEIGRYQLKYVHEKSEFASELPDAIRSFFLAYGFRASKLCKESFMGSLIEITDNYISINDIQTISFWAKSKYDWIPKIVGKDMKLEDPFLMKDINAFASLKDELKRQTMSLSLMGKVLHDELKVRCQNKLKPIYDQLVVPILKLSALGFNDRNKSLKTRWFGSRPSELHHLEELYKFWYKTVVFCELMLDVHSKAVANGRNGNGRAMTMFVPMHEKNVAQARREAGLDPEQPETLEQPISFEKSVTIKSDDLLFDSNDKHAKKLIQNFGTKSYPSSFGQLF